jgi:hypothetical protein
MPKFICRRRRRIARFGAVVSICGGLLLGVPQRAAAQSALPATTCDSAVANGDQHFPQGMPREDGTKAFRYGALSPFVSGGGAAITITLELTFTPSVDAVIKLAALDDACSGPTSSGTVLSATFTELDSQVNTLLVDIANGEVGLNGEMQKATILGTPRYVFVDVWDGELPSQHAAYSYVIDLQNPRNPGQP